jgi:hypothetical protein
MAKVVGKGTVIKQEIATTLTAVAQVLSWEHTGAESETFDCTTLDTSGAGKEYKATGYSEGGSCGFELFLDPALAGHQALTDDITTPAERDWSVTFADSGTSEWEWTSAGMSFSTTVAMNDGVKASVETKLTGLMSYDT